MDIHIVEWTDLPDIQVQKPRIIVSIRVAQSVRKTLGIVYALLC